jgi:uncharacterized protein (DUF2132 family)
MHPEACENGEAGFNDNDSAHNRKLESTRNRMTTEQLNNPLHGKTLETILRYLVEHYGWKEMGLRIKIKCFTDDPSISSSLKFLRKTPWARTKVEALYLECIRQATMESVLPLSCSMDSRGTRKTR